MKGCWLIPARVEEEIKSEIRNSKSETIPSFRMSRDPKPLRVCEAARARQWYDIRHGLVLSLAHWGFEFVSDFGIREAVAKLNRLCGGRI